MKDITTSPGAVRRLAAFTEDPHGGNPAGVWMGPELPTPAAMQAIAADVGFSETAFVTPIEGRRFLVRYYSPEAEVSFCGHATIATGVVLGRLHGAGTYALETAVGPVSVDVGLREGRWVASLTSVTPSHRAPTPEALSEALAALGWTEGQLDPAIPPAVAYGGAWHLVLAVGERETLDGLRYDFDALKRMMLREELTTLQLLWRENEHVFHARDPFPVGGVVEDPATGAAAAALGGYLRDAELLTAPTDFVILQGVVMGRPSRIEVSVPARGPITVSGAAVDLPDTSHPSRDEAEMSTPDERLAELGLVPAAPLKLPPGVTLPFPWVRVVGTRAVFSGHGPTDAEGNLALPLGKVGRDVTEEEAYRAARLVGLAVLGSLRRELGSLDRIACWTRIFGMVNCAPGFERMPAVINGFTDLVLEVFGPDVGAHARSAVGMAELPFGIPVEIEGEVELKG